MRIAFIDPANWDYNVNTPYQTPLGGSQSAVCYLAEALAARGHEVWTMTGTQTPGDYRGVKCRNLGAVQRDELRSLSLDAAVLVNVPQPARTLRDWLGPQSRLVMWTQHDIDQPAVQSLTDPDIRGVFDAFAFVSDWQRGRYVQQFSVPADRSFVRGNAISPAFVGLFPPGNSVSTTQAEPPVLVYTSTPFRGLDVLVTAFPEIRRVVPGARLQVFSSMQVYPNQRLTDEQFADLYQACRETDGIEYIGSVPQPELASRLRTATLLAYPNTFAETSCIAVMEAMAAGCRVVTTRYGALPETTAGHGELVVHSEDAVLLASEFVRTAVATLHARNRRDEWESRVRQQVDFVNREYTWPRRAEQWENWLTSELGLRPRDGVSPRDQDLAAAIEHHQSGRFPEALRLYQQVLQRDPQHPDALHLIGLIAHQFGKHDEAVNFIRQAITVRPNVGEYHANLAQILHAAQQFESAAATAAQAVTLQPRNQDAALCLAKSLVALQRADEARQAYSYLLQIAPGHPEAVRGLRELGVTE